MGKSQAISLLKDLVVILVSYWGIMHLALFTVIHK